MSAAQASRRAASTASASSAVETCVPFRSASPSMASSRIGRSFAADSAAAPVRARPPASAEPSPSSTSAMCASGARSPLAPTEPRLGSTGTMPALKIASACSIELGRTPE
jgi:hypothetical protein